jgi:hypothetical protein
VNARFARETSWVGRRFTRLTCEADNAARPQRDQK